MHGIHSPLTPDTDTTTTSTTPACLPRYQEAYTQLKEVAAAVGTALQAGPAAAVPYMTPGGAGAVQRHAEVCRVAEVVHFKVCTLLLHQQRFVEALQQLRDHLATYATPPGEGRCRRLWCHGCGWRKWL